MTLKQSWLRWKYAAKYENPIYREYLYVKDRVWAWWKGRDLRKAKKLAIARHRVKGETIYVLPDDKGRPRAFSSEEISLLKRYGRMSKKVTCVDLYKEAMFIANYINCKNLKK